MASRGGATWENGCRDRMASFGCAAVGCRFPLERSGCSVGKEQALDLEAALDLRERGARVGQGGILNNLAKQPTFLRRLNARAAQTFRRQDELRKTRSVRRREDVRTARALARGQPGSDLRIHRVRLPGAVGAKGERHSRQPTRAVHDVRKEMTFCRGTRGPQTRTCTGERTCSSVAPFQVASAERGVARQGLMGAAPPERSANTLCRVSKLFVWGVRPAERFHLLPGARSPISRLSGER